MNIVLTGFMASGKTEISKAISVISDYKLIDTDEMIVSETGKTINQIFAELGESEFRKIEHNIICRAAQLDKYVISTGGGVVLDKSNITQLRKNGIIVNLSPDFSVIEERLEKARSTRPLLQNQDIDDIRKRFNDRIPFYAECDLMIKVTNTKTPREYAEEILTLCQNR